MLQKKRNFYNSGFLLDSICISYSTEDETLLHIITHCEAFTRIRIEMFDQKKLTRHYLKSTLMMNILRYHGRKKLFWE